jgi:acylphosphatase
MNNAQLSRLHAIVEGHVQGVGFRNFVQDTAISMGLTGWVRNLWDGSVEVVAERRKPVLDRLLAALHRGPSMSTVTGVTPEWLSPTGEFRYFQVRSTSG